MKALVFHKPKHVSVDNVPDPKLEEPRDAILRVTATAICGSDLHIYNGLFPQPRSMVLGHEFMGVVEEVGAGVTNLKKGDRVIVPFPIACGVCWFCQKGQVPHCENSNKKNYGPEGGVASQKGGGLFGYTDLYGGYDGGQAEYVRVPYADFGPRKVPDGLRDEQVLFLTDILPTAWGGLEWAQAGPGDTVAVIGCGPVGLMALKLAWLRGAKRVIGVDIEPYRVAMAKRAGNCDVVDASRDDPAEVIRGMTDGRGADVVIEAVGMEAHRGPLKKLANAVHGQVGSIAAFETALSVVRRGGRISVMGVYGVPYDNFPFGQMFEKGVQVKAGQTYAQAYVDALLEHVRDGRVTADDIITHPMPLADAPKGYDLFNAKKDDCVKVVLKP